MTGTTQGNPFSTIRGLERHYAGHFHRKVVDWLAKCASFKDANGRDCYVVLEGIEQGDSLFTEEVSIRFMVSNDANARIESVPWNLSAIAPDRMQSVERRGMPSLFFTFSSELPLEENLANLREFVLQVMKRGNRPPAG